MKIFSPSRIYVEADERIVDINLVKVLVFDKSRDNRLKRINFIV